MLRDPVRVRTIAVLVGGAVGSLLRVGAARSFPHDPGQWPWATFAANLAGTLVLAWLVTRLTEAMPPTRYWREFLGTGFCGALTTFSTFQVETIDLAREGSPAIAAGYAAASLVAGMAIATAATIAARRRRYG
jgi:fluoride exporter